MTSLIISLVALIVALAGLLRDGWEHLLNRTTDVQALAFNNGQSGTVTQVNQERPRRKYSPSVVAHGSGTRYDVRTYLWVDDLVELKWKDLQVSADRFDNTSPALTCDIEIFDDESEQVWFGVGYNEPRLSGQTLDAHVRSQFVRSNLGRNEVQVWQWYRFSSARKWWQRQTRFTFWGGGTPEPLGRWKRVSTDGTRRQQFPTWDGVPTDR